jgi:hypothetical protein
LVCLGEVRIGRRLRRPDRTLVVDCRPDGGRRPRQLERAREPAGRAIRPLSRLGLSGSRRKLRLRAAGDRLDASPHAGARRGWKAGGRCSALPEDAFARGVRVRPLLGGCAASCGRALLSEASVRCAVHAGDGAQAAGHGPECCCNPAGACRRDRGGRAAMARVVCALQLS